MTQQRRDMMADYVTVAERIQAFYDRFPDGSLQSEVYLLTEEIVVMKSYAYRTADDPRPGIGHSSMLIPGSTNFTRGSEIENCESSSVGRAIAMLGFEVKRGIASRDEIDGKQGQRQGPPEPRPMRPRAPVAGSVDSEHLCPIHTTELLQFSFRTSKWGHMFEGQACVPEAQPEPERTAP